VHPLIQPVLSELTDSGRNIDNLYVGVGNIAGTVFSNSAPFADIGSSWFSSSDWSSAYLSYANSGSWFSLDGGD
jgi:hypothetical protein